MNVLVVDDQPTIARVTAVSLQLLGCGTFTAPGIAEAERILATEKIDALFLDINLGAESGLDYLDKIRSRPRPPPVVAFTAMDKDEIASEAMRRGALDCLLKPFSLEDLRRQLVRITQFLDQREKGTQRK